MEIFVKDLIEAFNSYAKEYPMVGGGITLWALGTATYLLRSIPKAAYDLFLRNFTTKLTLVNTSDSFHLFLKWYRDNNFSHNSRYIKISNGRWGYDRMIKAMGYGNHYFIFNRNLIKLNLLEVAAVGSDRERDIISMTLFGRSHKTFDKIFDSIDQSDLDKGKVVLHEYKESWCRVSEQRKRDISTIHLNHGKKDKI